MNNTIAIFRKQLKDTLKNKTVLIQFAMFPVLTLIMNGSIKIEGMPENFFVNLFATMYVGMAPLTSIASIMAEEKEKGTLRVLLMSNVKPYDYILGIGGYICLMCLLGSCVICAAGSYDTRSSLLFMGIMSVGIFASLLIGAAIGVWSKTQMMATSITIPAMMILSFVPILSMFNSLIAKFGKIFYSDQIRIMLNQLHNVRTESVCIVVLNIVVALLLFVVAYKKNKLD